MQVRIDELLRFSARGVIEAVYLEFFQQCVSPLGLRRCTVRGYFG